jgi:hypothetical protein
MRNVFVWCVLSLLGSTASADEPVRPEVKTLSGISILGNQEAPKSLVIVPWKSSEIGAGIGLSKSTDDQPIPVDRDVFARQLTYHQIRSNGNPQK